MARTSCESQALASTSKKSLWSSSTCVRCAELRSYSTWRRPYPAQPAGCCTRWLLDAANNTMHCPAHASRTPPHHSGDRLTSSVLMPLTTCPHAQATSGRMVASSLSLV